MLKQYSLLLWTRCYYAPSYRWGNLGKQILTYLCKISNLEDDGHRNSFSLQLPSALSVARNLGRPFSNSSFSFLGWVLSSCIFLSVCDLLVSDFYYCFVLKQGFISIKSPCFVVYLLLQYFVPERNSPKEITQML